MSDIFDSKCLFSICNSSETKEIYFFLNSIKIFKGSRFLINSKKLFIDFSYINIAINGETLYLLNIYFFVFSLILGNLNKKIFLFLLEYYYMKLNLFS